MPTLLVKCALPLLANNIVSMCNADMTESVFPDLFKHAIVQRQLKKPVFNPAELSSYRLISNLSFVLKTVELVVAARVSEHVKTARLLPSHQSTY